MKVIFAILAGSAITLAIKFNEPAFYGMSLIWSLASLDYIINNSK
jgi:hypothetical protein